MKDKIKEIFSEFMDHWNSAEYASWELDSQFNRWLDEKYPDIDTSYPEHTMD